MKKTFNFIMKRKISFGIFMVLSAIGVYLAVKSMDSAAAQTRYVLTEATKGTLITSVSGSGQVSASNQVDIKPKVSGTITSLPIKNGQEVRAGELLAIIDANEAQKTVRDAQISLESAKLSLIKLQKPADELSILQAENSLAQAQKSKTSAQDDLNKAYEDGFNTVANVFLDLPSIMAGLNDMLFSTTLNNSASRQNIDFYADVVKGYDATALQYRDDVYTAYKKARTEYDKNFSDYKSASRFSDTETIEALVNETYATTKDIAEAVKNANNLIQFYEDELIKHGLKPQSLADTHLASLNGYTGKTNTFLSNLFSVRRAIQTSKDTIVSADKSIAEKTQSLADLKAGADPLDVESQKLSIKQRENALADARAKLVDYYIRAPFDGTLVNVDAKKGDSASSSGTAIATLITKQKIAEISLNEIDAAQVKIGQKATLTFDAVEGLSITGNVIDVDTIGTVSQNVVSYDAKINFDTQDDRIKPGMSVSVSIITDVKQDVLMVPNAAVKTSNDTHYVQLLSSVTASSQSSANMANNSGVVSATLPKQQVVEIGLSNDSMTEIVSGIDEGVQVVTRTITAAASATQTQSQNKNANIRIPGL